MRLLQRLTVAEFFSMLDQFEKASDEPIAALRYVLKRTKEEHDSYERECMRSDAELEPIDRVEVLASDEALNNVLLTGPTGFFGPFLLSSLLRQTPYTFYALTRATDPDSRHGPYPSLAPPRASLDAGLDEELERRVHVVCGDIARTTSACNRSSGTRSLPGSRRSFTTRP